MEKRLIQLPKGGELEVSITDAFLKQVRDYFDIDSQSIVSNDHVRVFVYESFKSAVEKVEKNRLN